GQARVAGSDQERHHLQLPARCLHGHHAVLRRRLGCKNSKIPTSVTNLGEAAFAYCYDLTNIEIPNSVTNIGLYAFYSCYNLTSIEIPNSVTSIGESAFVYCNGLTSVEIPDSVKSVGSNAFAECSNLISVVIGDGVTSIGFAAFSSCSNLTSVVIGNSVTCVDLYAFYNCSNLTSVVIGNSVTNIKSGVFDECYNLTKITCLATTPPSVYYDTFSNYNADLYVPAGCKSAYETTEYWENFNIIEIEESNAIEYVEAEQEAEYFDLQGLPVKNPEKEGIYIIKRGNKVSKSIVR
ncbi:MAG: leucine-rich repeat domain-containing protein, partial [Muribaculaceae bacterium]|nr:leucine-rich repeat domain-containing protein [Muribaculaceae bacterium]